MAHCFNTKYPLRPSKDVRRYLSEQLLSACSLNFWCIVSTALSVHSLSISADIFSVPLMVPNFFPFLGPQISSGLLSLFVGSSYILFFLLTASSDRPHNLMRFFLLSLGLPPFAVRFFVRPWREFRFCPRTWLGGWLPDCFSFSDSGCSSSLLLLLLSLFVPFVFLTVFFLMKSILNSFE